VDGSSLKFVPHQNGAIDADQAKQEEEHSQYNALRLDRDLMA